MIVPASDSYDASSRIPNTSSASDNLTATPYSPDAFHAGCQVAIWQLPRDTVGPELLPAIFTNSFSRRQEPQDPNYRLPQRRVTLGCEVYVFLTVGVRTERGSWATIKEWLLSMNDQARAERRTDIADYTGMNGNIRLSLTWEGGPAVGTNSTAEVGEDVKAS